MWCQSEWQICLCFSGFPPIPGLKATGAEQGLIAALQAADKLASTDATEVADEEEDEKEEEEVGYQLHIIMFYTY